MPDEVKVMGDAVSTHSRPKAAVQFVKDQIKFFIVSTHSRPKAAELEVFRQCAGRLFQHTAARRRLFRQLKSPCHFARFNTQPPEGGCAAPYGKQVAKLVSTHSRPKAAERQRMVRARRNHVSTHSRPKAAAKTHPLACTACLFQHTAARRRLNNLKALRQQHGLFQHTAARRRLF